MAVDDRLDRGSTSELDRGSRLEAAPPRVDARASGPRPGRSCSRSRSSSAAWQVVVWTHWKPEYVAARRRSPCLDQLVARTAAR